MAAKIIAKSSLSRSRAKQKVKLLVTLVNIRNQNT
jgi:hypothetical protein